MHNMQLWSPKWQGTSFESLLKATRVDKSLATTLEQHFKLSLVRLRRHAILAKCINGSSKILVEAPSSSEKGTDGQRGRDWLLEKPLWTHTASLAAFPYIPHCALKLSLKIQI